MLSSWKRDASELRPATPAPAPARPAKLAALIASVLLAAMLGAAPANALAPPSEPVLLIHGLSGSANGTWGHFRNFLIDQGWSWGGSPTYQPDSGQVYDAREDFGPELSSGDFYTMNMSDFAQENPSQNLLLARQGFEVSAAIQAILDANPGATDVALIGQSMGGLAARSYLQSLALQVGGSGLVSYRGDVSVLVTVGTPHGGSLVAQSYWSTCLESQNAEICGATSSLLGIQPHSVAIAEIRKGSPTLDTLNDLESYPLPSDVVFRSVVNTGLAEILTPLLDVPLSGDGVVTEIEQDLGELGPRSAVSHSVLPVALDPAPSCGHLTPAESHTCAPHHLKVWATVLSALSVEPEHLELALDVVHDPVRPGERYLAVARVSNAGPEPLQGVTVESRMPDYLEPFEERLAGGAACPSTSFDADECNPGEPITWALGTLDPGETEFVVLESVVTTDEEAPPAGTSIPALAVASHDAAGIVREDDAVRTRAAPVLHVATSQRDAVRPGSHFVARILASNRGGVDAPQSELRVLLPDGVRVVSAPGAEDTGGVLRWDLGTLRTGASTQRRLVLEADEELSAGELLELEVAVEGGTSGQHAASTRASWLVREAEPLSLSAAVRADPAIPGEQLSVVLSARNEGSEPLTGVTVTARLPQFLYSFQEHLAHADCPSTFFDADECDSGEFASWNVGTLSPGETARVRMTPVVTDGPSDGRILPFLAFAAREGGGEASARTMLLTDREPVLATSVNGEFEPAAGETYTLELVASNRGGVDSPDTMLELPIPQGAEFVSASSGGRRVGDRVVFDLGLLRRSTSTSRSVTLRAEDGMPEGRASEVSATVQGGTRDQHNARATDTASVSGSPVLSLGTQVSPDPVGLGETMTATFSVANQSGETLTGVEVESRVPQYLHEFDEVSAGAECPSTSFDADECNPGEPIVWNVGTLVPDQTATVLMSSEIEYLPPRGTPLRITGVASDSLGESQATSSDVVRLGNALILAPEPESATLALAALGSLLALCALRARASCPPQG